MARSHRRQRAQQRLLDGEQGERLLTGGTVGTHPRFRHYPGSSLRVEIGKIAKLSRGQEVALDVFDAGLDDTFLRRIRGRPRVDLETVPFRALGVGALHQRIAGAGAGDRALGIVDDQPRRNGGEPFEGAAMTAEPSGYRLIPDELDVLMAREAQRHHEGPGAPPLVARGIEQHRPGAEIDLRRFARTELQPHGRLGRARRRHRPQHAPHRRVAAAVPMLATQRSVDRDTPHTLLGPARHHIAKRLDRGNRAARPARLAEHRRDLAVLRQRRVGGEPAMLRGQRPQHCHLGPAHQPRPSNVAVGIALAQAHQDRSILEHLESPAPHRGSPSGQKSERVAVTRSVRDARPHPAGSNTPITEWLLYADHGVAPICRSLTPATRYQFAEWKTAIVNIDYHIDADGHYYSVPHRLARQKVEVRITAPTVECFYHGKRVAAHLRSGLRGRHTTLPEHMPDAHRKHLEWTPGRLLNWALSIGPATRNVVQWQFDHRPHPEQGYRACLGLLNLAKHCGAERLEAACQRALAIGSPTRKSIKSILDARLDQHPELFPTTAAAETSPPPPQHANVRGPDYFRSHKRSAESRGNPAPRRSFTLALREGQSPFEIHRERARCGG